MLEEGTIEYREIEAVNVMISVEKEQRERDCEAALESLLALQAQFQGLQSEREAEEILRDQEKAQRDALYEASKGAANAGESSLKSYSDSIAKLQDKISETEHVLTASQARTVDLSKVLRTSQTRTEELLEENLRYFNPLRARASFSSSCHRVWNQILYS